MKVERRGMSDPLQASTEGGDSPADGSRISGPSASPRALNYEQLRQVAQRLMSQEPKDSTLTATASPEHR